jgi:hypothetical protein
MHAITRTCWLAAIMLAVGLAAWRVTAEPPAAEVQRKPSTYAPARDLEAQVQFFLDRIKEDLTDAGDYSESRRKRVVRDANTLAVLALVLSRHDEPHGLKNSAPALLDRALKLAESAADRAQAQQAYAELLDSRKVASAHTPPAWSSVGNIVELMNQVPHLDRSLRGTVRSETRFAASPEKATGLAATLAVIAHVSMFDDSYCTDAHDRDEWIEWCVLMRDAAWDVNRAVSAGQQAAALEALAPLSRTCDGCHEKFKD